MNPLAIKASISAIIGLGLFLSGYGYGKSRGDVKVSALEKNITAERLAIAQDTLEKSLANEKLLNEVGEENERNRILVADLNRRLVSGRVRLPADLCTDYGQADPATAGEPAIAASGVLPVDAGGGLDRVQQALDWYVERQKARAEMTEQVMLLCRPVNDWAKGQ